MEEYLKKEELISHPESISRLCGFTMFMGELFLHLEVRILIYLVASRTKAT
jgi:hypothetical protein